MDQMSVPTQPENPNWIPDIPEQDPKKDQRAIREEYFCAADPRDTWKFGLVGLILSAITCIALFEKATYLNIFMWFFIGWAGLFAFMIVFDHYFILWACKDPEITNKTTFSFIDRIYKILNPPVTKEEKEKYPNGVPIQRNLIKYKVTSWAETIWYTRNISGNLVLVNFCRLYQFALYFFKNFIGIINHKYVHTKASFFFIINASLCAYVREHKEQQKNPKTGKTEEVEVTTLQFKKVRLPVNNYGLIAKIWKMNLKYRDFDVKIYLDSEKEIVSELQITLLDYDPKDKQLDPEFGKNHKKLTILKPDTEDNRYQIHTFIVLLNTFVAHVNSHVMSTFITDLDETDFPKRKWAGTAISGLNNAGIWVSTLVTGPISVPIIVNNVNLGYPHFPVVENRVLQRKSQLYIIMRKIFDDKELVRKCTQKKYRDQFMQEYNAERDRLLQQDSTQEIPKYDPRFEVTRSKILRSSIANCFALHGIDHYIHDRFTPIYCYNDYLSYNDVRQHFFGGKWNCDISSNFQKPCGPISEIVYRIVKNWGGQQLYKGFQWTLEQ